MADKINDEEFLSYIVKALVDHPNDVVIKRTVDEMGVLLSIKLNKEDMGQIIGRQGSTVRALRTLLRIVGIKNHSRINLKVEEPEGGSKVSQSSKAKDNLDDLKI